MINPFITFPLMSFFISLAASLHELSHFIRITVTHGNTYTTTIYYLTLFVCIGFYFFLFFSFCCILCLRARARLYFVIPPSFCIAKSLFKTTKSMCNCSRCRRSRH
uniref:(northern house mosquito) hypothetical protein n=1 Tax=Culex pipiens TaxID=7175 RepID=A0A8D8FK36_CULPI